jgi:hypothetical protein
MHTNDNRRPTALRSREQRAEERRQARSRTLWRMTPGERVRAMWAGQLSFSQLREWSSLRPDEVPLICGEFAWLVMNTPEWAEASETTVGAAATKTDAAADQELAA